MSAGPPVFPAPPSPPRWPEAVIDRACGAFLGLAIGDALGTPLEFSERDSLPRQTEMTGGGPFRLNPGQWTDDTAMALALADSLVRCRGLDLADLMGRFVQWWRFGAYSCTGRCFDIGALTAQALGRFEATGEPFSGAAHERAAGNGSLMRAAILGERDPLQPRDFAGHPTIAAIAAGSWKGKPREKIRSSGYVVDTLEAAFWAVGSTESFEEALILAVNLADDADTVGAVTGQIAGAIYGASAIPERWLAPLAWRETIEAASLALLDLGNPAG